METEGSQVEYLSVEVKKRRGGNHVGRGRTVEEREMEEMEVGDAEDL